VVDKINAFRLVVNDKTKSVDDRRFALRFLIHCIEDLHQPCHVADNHDKGGNQTQVGWFDRGSNMHRVWDSASSSGQALPRTSGLRIGFQVGVPLVRALRYADGLTGVRALAARSANAATRRRSTALDMLAARSYTLEFEPRRDIIKPLVFCRRRTSDEEVDQWRSRSLANVGDPLLLQTRLLANRVSARRAATDFLLSPRKNLCC
jgi:hypothetical protein